MTILTHTGVLAEAQKWRITNNLDTRAEAIRVLEAGMLEFPEALALGDELVLLHKENGDLDQAIDLLRTLKRRFLYIGEETLCRWASVLRNQANMVLAGHAPAAAIPYLKESEGYFAQAFEEFGTHYPRVNQLSTRFVRAALARQLKDETTSNNLLQSVEKECEPFLNDEGIWSRLKPHDNVWAPASRGEAFLLLERFDDAELAYAEAIRAAGGQDYPRQCMARQIRETLIPAFQQLSRAIDGRLANPDVFFDIPQNEPENHPATERKSGRKADLDECDN